MLLLLVACSEYDLADHQKDTRGREPHDTADVLVDSGDLDTGGADDTGVVPTGADSGDGCDAGRTVRIGLAADDVWEGWVDGVSFGTAESWWQATWTEAHLDCGSHVLSVYATDLHQAIAGFIAVVEVEGAVVNTSADGTWKVIPGHGGAGWKDAGFDDSTWGAGQACNRADATGWWGGSPTDLIADGAWWLWPQDCLALGDGSFRLRFEVR